MEENTAMAVMTIAICDEIRKDAQKLVKQLSALVPEAEIIVYRTRESLLDGLSEGHKVCNLIFLGLDGERGNSLETVRAMRLKGNYIPVVMVAENERFYKEAFEVFAYNYLTKPVDSGELEHVLIPVLEACEREGGRALHFHYQRSCSSRQELLQESNVLHNVFLLQCFRTSATANLIWTIRIKMDDLPDILRDILKKCHNRKTMIFLFFHDRFQDFHVIQQLF